MKRLQIGRVALGTVLGTLVAATWLTATLIADARLYSGFKTALSFEGFLLVGGIQFLTVGAVFLVIGIPMYFLSLGIGTRKNVFGILFGFTLGMIGSVGYGVDWHLRNLLVGVIVFGIAGMLAAITFLFVAERG